jgi:large subunit ribosomal protein L10
MLLKESKKVGLFIREQIIGELKTKAQSSEGCILIGFNKIPAYSFNILRNDLKSSGADIFVARNSLFKRAFNELGWQNLEALLDSETSIIFIYDKDVAKACKSLVDFMKENEALRLKGGIIQAKNVNADDIDAIAKLPSKNMLLAMAVSGLASPLSGFVCSLNQIILKFLWVIEELKKSKTKKTE